MKFIKFCQINFIYKFLLPEKVNFEFQCNRHLKICVLILLSTVWLPIAPVLICCVGSSTWNDFFAVLRHSVHMAILFWWHHNVDPKFFEFQIFLDWFYQMQNSFTYLPADWSAASTHILVYHLNPAKKSVFLFLLFFKI